jgi:hypothetical protein
MNRTTAMVRRFRQLTKNCGVRMLVCTGGLRNLSAESPSWRASNGSAFPNYGNC